MLGRTVGHYRIESKLGEGGMGVVYRAEDVHLSRPVALKFLHSSTDTARLLAEATAAGAISHPNICTVYEVDPEHAFIAMEYIDGRTLKARIDNRPLPADEALRIALAIGEGLRAAHAKGIIHRDIKSANVMVSETGDVKVMDFGLARSAAQADATREGYSSGTPGYMAPEQERGEPLDRRADIWAFGAVLHEMLTGRLPTGGIGMVPASLDRIVRKALARERGKRYQHIEDALVDLRRVQAPKQSTLRMTIAVCAAAAGVAIAAGTWWWTLRAPKTAPEVALQAVPLTSYPGSERHPSFSPDGTQVAFTWYREKSTGIYIKQIGVEEATPLVDTPAPEMMPAWSPDGSQIAFVRLLNDDRLAVVVIPQRGGPARTLADFVIPSEKARGFSRWILGWAPDGKTLVAAGRESMEVPAALYALSLATGEKSRLTWPEIGMDDADPSVSPNGRTLAFARSGTNGQADIHLMPLTPDGRPGGDTVKQPGVNRINRGPVWTADGREIVFDAAPSFGVDSALWRLEARRPAAPRRLTLSTASAEGAAIAPRGNNLAYGVRAVSCKIWRVNLSGADPGVRRPQQFLVSTQSDFEPDFSPDGNRIAFASIRNGFDEIWMCDREGSHMVPLTSSRGPAVQRPRWSPDGRHITFWGEAKGNRDIWVVTPGGEPRQITDHPSHDTNPEWSRDGQWIYFISDRSGKGPSTWKVPAAGGDPIPVAGITTVVQESYDGRWLYFRASPSFRDLEGAVRRRGSRAVRGCDEWGLEGSGRRYLFCWAEARGWQRANSVQKFSDRKS